MKHVGIVVVMLAAVWLVSGIGCVHSCIIAICASGWLMLTCNPIVASVVRFCIPLFITLEAVSHRMRCVLNTVTTPGEDAAPPFPGVSPVIQLEHKLNDQVADITRSAHSTESAAEAASKAAMEALEATTTANKNLQKLAQENAGANHEIQTAIANAVADQRRSIQEHEQAEAQSRLNEEAFKTQTSTAEQLKQQHRDFMAHHKAAEHEMRVKKKVAKQQEHRHKRHAVMEEQHKNAARRSHHRERRAKRKAKAIAKKERLAYLREEKEEQEEDRLERIREQNEMAIDGKQEDHDDKKEHAAIDFHHKKETYDEVSAYKEEFGAGYVNGVAPPLPMPKYGQGPVENEKLVVVNGEAVAQESDDEDQQHKKKKKSKKHAKSKGRRAAEEEEDEKAQQSVEQVEVDIPDVTPISSHPTEDTDLARHPDAEALPGITVDVPIGSSFLQVSESVGRPLPKKLAAVRRASRRLQHRPAPPPRL